MERADDLHLPFFIKAEVNDLAEKEIDLRRLVIKAFHMTDVEFGEHNDITVDGHMTVSKEMLDELVAKEEHIERSIFRSLNQATMTVDPIPSWISSRSPQRCWENWARASHIRSQACTSMLTGVDVNGKQSHEFGSSEGNLKDQLYLNRAGTPGGQ